MRIKKLGLAGKSGSGKDHVADYLCEKYGFQKTAVADPIRSETFEFLESALLHEVLQRNLPRKHFETVIKAFTSMIYEKPTPYGIRVLQQVWGTEYRREEDPDYWIKFLKAELQHHESLVVSDVRLPIEMEEIRRHNGEIWFVDRPGVGDVGLKGHATENALKGLWFDRHIINDGRLADLEGKIESIMAEYIDLDILTMTKLPDSIGSGKHK